MHINIIYLFYFIISASYIGTVSINECLLKNGYFLRLFTYYTRYRSIFLLIQYIAWGVLLYIVYLYYKDYGISLMLLVIILTGYNISGLLRSFFRDWLFIGFYLYPFFIVGFFYQLFYPINFTVPVSKGPFIIIFFIIFTIQGFLDKKYLKQEIEQYIAIFPSKSDFSQMENQSKLIESMKSANPYYSDSQIVSALREVLVK